MKTNKIKHREHHAPLAIAAIVIIGITLVGLYIGYEKLRELWLEQSIIRDMDRQVTIASGKMVKAEVIATYFGLKPGANLSLIDYQKKREEILASVANLKDLRVRRQLPDRVIIDFEERVPIARLGIKGQRKDLGYVVDADGVVFRCFRNTQLLPIIHEGTRQSASAGRRVTARSRAAIKLLDICRNSEFQDIGILDIDTTSPDYLFVTINTGTNYTRLKLAWEGMDNPSPASDAELIERLTRLKQAFASRIGTNAVIWNATEKSRIYADTKGKL